MKHLELSSERLNLVNPSENHAEDLLLLRSNKLVNKFIDRKAPEKLEEVIAFIETISENNKNNKSCYWCISEKNHKKVIGTICLWNFLEDKKTAEIGYELHPDYHGKGIMGEALKTVLVFGFKTLGLETIEAFTHKENHNSTKLLSKHLFKHATERQDKHNENNIVFVLNKEQYLF